MFMYVLVYLYASSASPTGSTLWPNTRPEGGYLALRKSAWEVNTYGTFFVVKITK